MHGEKIVFVKIHILVIVNPHYTSRVSLLLPAEAKVELGPRCKQQRYPMGVSGV